MLAFFSLCRSEGCGPETSMMRKSVGRRTGFQRNPTHYRGTTAMSGSGFERVPCRSGASRRTAKPFAKGAAGRLGGKTNGRHVRLRLWRHLNDPSIKKLDAARLLQKTFERSAYRISRLSGRNDRGSLAHGESSWGIHHQDYTAESVKIMSQSTAPLPGNPCPPAPTS